MNSYLYEHKSRPLAPKKVFYARVLKASLLSFSLFSFTLLLGIVGYSQFAKLSLIDSFLNAAMIFGGMGPIDDFKNASDTAKIFGGFYAIFCGIFFLLGFTIFISPVVHRFLHRFHMEVDK